jgi:hypothetical protein
MTFGSLENGQEMLLTPSTYHLTVNRTFMMNSVLGTAS